ncbi:MAG: cation diffusion facilitator family transporter [Clostridium sp.]|uniref:cation diffusion facilitator family transporter n=1 Tax=Clostridium sp. DSM 8431 TaxID=1761781 RepID=UPI0008F08481|nr:cation diffusion facilitator family transporter [Clostridium sp. DSM 8431]MCR4944506.1 cation diffusion facilitator family transporter [Clostridium sp.]SFU82791.1 cation diffusion facilitator family transporter [Clostridium sp. DSM 8431]
MKVRKFNLKNNDSKDIAMKVSWISITANLLLSLFKLLAGIIGKSGAMISDSIHSASDVFSTFIVVIGIRISNKASDDEHQYGHERFECVASIILSIILFLIGVGIGYEGILKIINREEKALAMPGTIALVAAIISIMVKEWMYWYTKKAAKKINSTALMADAWHHRSDSLSSIGALIGIAASKKGFPICDSIASIVIAIFIIKAAYEVFKDSIDKLIDKSCDVDVVENMKKVILNEEGVIDIDDIRTRLFGSKIYVDIEIAADGNKTLTEVHKIAQNVHDSIEREFPDVKHCMVHVNPRT